MTVWHVVAVVAVLWAWGHVLDETETATAATVATAAAVLALLGLSKLVAA